MSESEPRSNICAVRKSWFGRNGIILIFTSTAFSQPFENIVTSILVAVLLSLQRLCRC